MTAVGRVVEADRAYVGALLLHQRADAAALSAALVEPDDLADPRLRVVHRLAAELAGQGVVPDPVVVLAHARSEGTVTTAHAIGELGMLLHELFAACPLPAQVGWYAVVVVDAALRRRCAELAERIGQAAETASLADLVGLVGAEVLAVYALRNRRADVLAELGMPVEEVAA